MLSHCYDHFSLTSKQFFFALSHSLVSIRWLCSFVHFNVSSVFHLHFFESKRQKMIRKTKEKKMNNFITMIFKIVLRFHIVPTYCCVFPYQATATAIWRRNGMKKMSHSHQTKPSEIDLRAHFKWDIRAFQMSTHSKFRGQYQPFFNLSLDRVYMISVSM